ncbi:MAG: HAD hydrolase family protein, partial [Eggerthellaceae bacterium]|nr:HAD hydrolase family protein [Eggerthellaceae bacterium]
IKTSFFDFDGTLYDGKIPDAGFMRLYAKKMRERGGKICLATGRHIDFLEDATKFFPDFDGFIIMNV